MESRGQFIIINTVFSAPLAAAAALMNPEMGNCQTSPPLIRNTLAEGDDVIFPQIHRPLITPESGQTHTHTHTHTHTRTHTHTHTYIYTYTNTNTYTYTHT